MHEDIKAILISEEQIKKRVQELGEQLSGEYAGKQVIMICLLKGAAYFACDLSRAMSIPVQTKKPASIKTVAMCDKEDRRQNGLEADYVGFTIPDEFVVGYGLDYAGDYRNLPFIGVLKPVVYARA